MLAFPCLSLSINSTFFYGQPPEYRPCSHWKGSWPHRPLNKSGIKLSSRFSSLCFPIEKGITRIYDQLPVLPFIRNQFPFLFKVYRIIGNSLLFRHPQAFMAGESLSVAHLTEFPFLYPHHTAFLPAGNSVFDD